jgi:hypothetical protein
VEVIYFDASDPYGVVFHTIPALCSSTP